MPATRVHLVRHGEVHNPGGVLYGRLPHFHLSENGKKMASAAALALQEAGIQPSKLIVSTAKNSAVSRANRRII